MTPQDTKTSPFFNRGIRARTDAAVLQPGEYGDLLNTLTVQDGAITTRLGAANLTPALSNPGGPFNNPQVISTPDGNEIERLHTISKLRVSATDTANARYFGYGQEVYRAFPNSSGEYPTAVQIALDAANAVYLAGNERFSCTPYLTGALSKPSMYFATSKGNVRDDGTLSKLEQWGIPRPYAPAVCSAGISTPQAIYLPVMPSATLRIAVSVVVANIVAVNVIAGVGLYRFPYTVAGPGAHPIDGVAMKYSSTIIIPQNVTQTSPGSTTGTFEAYLAAPLSGTTISIEAALSTDLVSSGGYVSETVYFNATPIDLSLGGKASDGYETDDAIHFTIWASNPGLMQDIRIRIGVGESVTPVDAQPIDYYEHVITPNPAQSLSQGSVDPGNDSSIYDVGLDQSFYTDQGLVGDYYNRNDQYTQQFRPSQLPPVPADTPAIYDGAVPKRQWIKAGRAGNPGFNWLNVTSVTIQGRLAGGDTVTVFELQAGNIYVQGGSGPDTTIAGAVPYDYRYQFCNPQTNAKGAPSVAMIQENFVETQRTSVIVQVGGYDGDLPGRAPITFGGEGSILLYRRGGAYTDGLYRLVKKAAISGVDSNNSVSIIDDVPDVDIISAPVLEEDDDAPVSSPLPVAIRGTIASFTTSGIGVIRFTATITSGDTSKLRVRSIIEVGNGSTFEQSVVATIHSVSSGSIDISVFAQRAHSTGEIIQVNAVAEQPCTLSTKAFDCLFLAGDENNPSTLYKSKPGQPESFPAVDATLRTLGRSLITAPSDPIVVIDEFNAEVVCITRNSIFTVAVWNGIMQKPLEAPAGRGAVDRRCYCKGDNALYYLSIDGIYAWAGGTSVKLTDAIDWIFNQKTVNGIPPLNYNLLEFASMEYARNAIHFTYVATNGLFYKLVFETIFDRWTVEIVNNSLGNTDAITVLYREPDTATFLCGRYNTDTTNTAFEVDQYFQQGTVGCSDGYVRSSDPTGIAGTPINFRLATPAYTAGDPSMQKLITQAILELSNPWSDVTVDVYYNYSNVPSADQFVIPAEKGVGSVSGVTLTAASGIAFTREMVGGQVITAGGQTANIVGFISATQLTLSNSVTLSAAAFYINRRRRVPLPFGTISGTAAGSECYAMAFVLSGSTKIPTTFYSMTFDVAPLAEIQRAKGYDWQDFGWPWDKAFNVLNVEFDCGGQSVALTIDTITGVDGDTQTLGVNTFIVGGPGITRGKKAIPVRSAAGARVIAKMLRVRPTITTSNFQIFSIDAEFDKYPADILPFTEPEDGGYQWEKYFTQLLLDVDTGGITATISILIDDDVSAAQIVTVNSTNVDRNREITLQSGLRGKKIRMNIQVGTGGKFQLFNHKWVWTPADKGAVVHSFDFDDVGHPFDKRFYHVFFEYEVTATTSFLLEGISGVAGNQTTSVITSFQATPSGRKQQQWQFPINSIYKMVRIIPASGAPNVVAKIYQPQYKYEPLPADIVPYTEPDNSGSPFLKYYQQLLIDVDTGGVEATIQVEIDGAVVQTLNVTTTALDRNRTLTLRGSLIGRMSRILNTPGAGAAAKFQLFTHAFVTLPADKGPVLHTFDWDNVGHEYDKRFYWMTFEYQIATPMSVVLYGIRGIAGAQTEEVIQTFALTETGSPRKTQQFNFPNNSIYKMVRLAPASGTPTTDSLIWKPVFQKEDYPPDIALYTEPDDSGTEYRKWYQQIDLDVDTGGVQALISIEVDGVVAQAGIPVTSTALDRKRQLTLNPGIIGRLARILVTPGSGGKFQLFRSSFITLPADRGPVLASFDWDDLGHPYEKRLKSISFEAEIEQSSAEMIMDIISGADGTIMQLDYMRFQIAGPTRVFQTVAIKDQTFAVMIRIRPATTNVNFKHWKYVLAKDNLPASNTLFTDYDDAGYPCEKILRSIILDVDTGGVDANVGLEVDGEIRHRFVVNTRDTDRNRTITVPSDIIGYRFRLLPHAGANGKFQLYSSQYERILEPCRVSHWDSYEQSFGSNGYKMCKQIWIEYLSGCPLRLRFYCDAGKLLWEEDLPQHDKREVYRFYLPKVSLDGRVYNKSKIYRFTIDAMPSEGGWFKFYRDATRLEILNTSQDQRAAWQQSYAWQQMPIPI